MPGAHPANLVEPATRNSTSTHAPKPSWTASPRSRPILPPTATPARALYRNSAVSARPRSADSKSGSPRATVKLYLFKYRERRKDRRKKWQQGYYRTNREKIGAYDCWVHKQQIAERRRRKYYADRAAIFGKAKSNHDQAPFHLSCRTTRRSRRAPSRV